MFGRAEKANVTVIPNTINELKNPHLKKTPCVNVNPLGVFYLLTVFFCE